MLSSSLNLHGRFHTIARAIVVCVAIVLGLTQLSHAQKGPPPNPQVAPGGNVRIDGTMGGTPADGDGWEITLGMTQIATDEAPNGWNIYEGPNIGENFVSAPVSATVIANYRAIHFRRGLPGFAGYYTANFDVIAGVANADIPPPAWAQGVVAADSLGAGGAGPSGASSVNLASGAFENDPGPDMVSRNPIGPNAVYARRYRSPRSQASYGSPGLSPGWTDNYDVTIVGPSQPGWGALTISYPNGATESVTPILAGVPPAPNGEFSEPAGAPYFVTGVPSGAVGRWQSLTFTFTDRSTWRLTPDQNNTNRYLLTRIANLLGNGINVNYDYANGNRLLSVVNDQSVIHLSFTYSGSSLFTVTDAYDREVRYGFAPVGSINCLTSVSQIVASGTPSPPAEWIYGYTQIGTKVFLSSIAVQNPTGALGTISHPINYDVNARVESTLDANGNRRVFRYSGATTKVEVKNIAGAVVESWTQKVGALNRDTGTIDANNQTNSATYGDSSNPYSATTIANKNNQSYIFTFDGFGGMMTARDPRLLTTTVIRQYDPNHFPLGRVTEVQVGSKTSTQYFYYPEDDPARKGMLQSIKTPTPGTVGGGSRETRTFDYTTLGNIATVTTPAPNNSGGSVTWTFNYTSDGRGYSKPEALGEPVMITDPNGNKRRFRYDTRGTVVMSTEEPEPTCFWIRSTHTISSIN